MEEWKERLGGKGREPWVHVEELGYRVSVGEHEDVEMIVVVIADQYECT